MSRAKQSASEQPSKREALTLAQLAAHDDLLTDALVDQVYSWFAIRKNRARYSACRGIREEDVTRILQQHVVIEKDPAKAVAELLALPGIKRYFDRLGRNEEKEHFRHHMRKYVNIYMTDCAFEITATNRYTIDTQEAAVSARHVIKKGEEIKYLCGIQVPISQEEERDLDLTRRDFSIVMSSRKKTPSLFLGPARFANHDCNANARLQTRGHRSMTVAAARDIQLDEEITVSYGVDYFGQDNVECLCATCERLQRNGWAQAEVAGEGEEAVGGIETALLEPGDAPRYRTRRSSSIRSQSPTLSTSQPGTPSSRKRKYSADESSPSTPHATKASRTERVVSAAPRTPSALRNEYRPGDDGNALAPLTDPTPPRTSSPSPSTGGLRSTELSTQGTSVSDQAESVARRSSAKGDTDGDLAALKEELAKHLPHPPHSTQEASADESVPQMPESSQLAQQTIETTDELTAPASDPPPSDPLPLDSLPTLNVEPDTPLSSSSSDTARLNNHNTHKRTPGDYTLTTRLLSTPYSRWVQCHVCEASFVQEDAYLTRYACPRCERHSKLYGFRWPKTEREGKHDADERVLDHRTVHRFVRPDEERVTKKGKGRALAAILDAGTARASSTPPPSSSDAAPLKRKKTKKADKKEDEEVAIAPPARPKRHAATPTSRHRSSRSSAASTPRTKRATPVKSPREASSAASSPASRQNPQRSTRRTSGYAALAAGS